MAALYRLSNYLVSHGCHRYAAVCSSFALCTYIVWNYSSFVEQVVLTATETQK